MLVVISPAKRLDWEGAPAGGTDPAFRADANRLAAHARQLSLAKLTSLMDLSDDLARLNRDRFRTFDAEPDGAITRQAAFAFAGDTYLGLEAGSLAEDDLRWADGRLWILSGLYGLLRPQDGIQPYRLEMGSRLKTRRGSTLYAYWGETLAKHLNAAAEEAGSSVLLNCASQEYFGAVDQKRLSLPVISPVFLEERNGQAKTVSFFAKRARGALARFVVERRISDPEGLLEFDTGGYRYDPDRSDPQSPVFVRPAVTAGSAAA